MKGARALAFGLLLLAAVCAVPAVSAAQESDSPADTATTATTTTLDQALPPDSADPPAGPSTNGGEPASSAQPAGTAASPPDQGVTVSGPDSAGRAHTSASASVNIVDFSFSPQSVSVAVGDTVTWHNTGQAPHNATADDGSFKTPDLNNGQSASNRFTTAGTFSYTCTIHPFMHGTVRVLSASGSGGKSGGGSAGSSSSSGSNLTEEQAVASPDAAGNSTTLPMTGLAAGALALVGAGLLSLGLIARLVRLVRL